MSFMMEHEYREAVYADKQRALFVYMLVAAVCFTAGVLGLGLCYAVAGLMLVGAYADTRPFRIHVRHNTLSFGYWYGTHEVNTDDIEWIATENMSEECHNDVSLRADIEANPRFVREGSGVRIRVRNQKRDWVIPSDDPNALASALGRQLLPRHPTPPPTLSLVQSGFPTIPEPDFYDYEEDLWPGWKQWATFTGFSAFVVFEIVSRRPKQPDHLIAIAFFLFVCVGMLSHIRERMHHLKTRIRVGGERLFVGYGPRPQAMWPVREIEWVAKDKVRRFGGASHDRNTGAVTYTYAPTPGPAIRMRTRNDPRHVIIRTNNPEGLAAALGKPLLSEPPMAVAADVGGDS